MKYSASPIGAIITKGYFVVEPDGRKCKAEVVKVYQTTDGPETEQDPCEKDATLCIDIKTSTMKGKQIKSKIGFCDKHFPRKYKDWFGIKVESFDV